MNSPSTSTSTSASASNPMSAELPRDGLPGNGERRDVLAAERTFLAWIRTCLALLAGGAALGTFPALPYPAARAVLGVACMACAGLLAVTACRNWSRVRRAASADPFAPGPRSAQLLTAAVLVVALALSVPSASRLLDGSRHHHRTTGDQAPPLSGRRSPRPERTPSRSTSCRPWSSARPPARRAAPARPGDPHGPSRTRSRPAHASGRRSARTTRSARHRWCRSAPGRRTAASRCRR
ncbi:DUF202 domain-containing protein [Streptacidiphilus sp. NEAU-YB345]|uniref:DUF202 domain-containing protein n=1 Tax=Streptacidiphilus fuscans TaxID=2789292 RepID=A0A931BAQ6_9ACTN|nr:DUF202 domain-containing protein [Streptacidiphilus fuscans]